MFKMIDAAGVESAAFDGDTLVSYARQGVIQPSTVILDVAAGQCMQASEHPLLGGGAPPQYALGNHIPYIPNSQPAGKASSAALAFVVAGLVFLVVFFGLSALKKHSLPRGANLNQAQTIAMADGRYGLTAPADWVREKTDHDNIVSYTASGGEGGVTAMRINQTTTDPGGLIDLMNQTAAMAAHGMQGAPVGNPTAVTVNGFPGYQQEIRLSGIIQNTQVRYTVLQTPEGAYALTLFVHSRSRQSLSDLATITQSFHRLPVGASAPLSR
ncbi:MAG: hypothetical protein JWQ02_2606 [Capsulimonas sp.]|nr:hypothetical protein [Capsulimonas sp.]